MLILILPPARVVHILPPARLLRAARWRRAAGVEEGEGAEEEAPFLRPCQQPLGAAAAVVRTLRPLLFLSREALQRRLIGGVSGRQQQ